MNNDPSAPSADLDDLQGERAVSAFFNDLDAANKVAEELGNAGFASGTVYVIPHAPGYAVTVTNPDRIPEATKILQGAGGEIRLKEKAPAEGTISRSAASTLPGRESATGDSVGGGMFTPGSSAGGDGAGTASGGALY